MQTLSKKNIFITGASSGIGLACADNFAQRGCNLAITARSYNKLKIIANDLSEKYKIKCIYFEHDVRDNKSTAKIAEEALKQFGSFDILVNNAGLSRGLDKVQEGQTEDWDEVIDTNIKGALYMVRSLLPSMIKNNKGHIINLGSTAGHIVYPGGAVYCGTKHFIDALSRGLKQELHGTRVRVTSIDPGAVKTNFSNIRFKGDLERADNVYKNMQPLTAQDIAEIIVFCASRPEHVNINDIIITATDQNLPL